MRENSRVCEKWILDPKNTLEELWSDCSTSLEKWSPEAFKQVKNTISGTKDFQVRITMLGTYSSGKSSIVNALIGEKVAEIGKAPTTDHVAEFIWQNAVLVDTPGLLAREEEQARTLDEIPRANAILYVIPLSLSKADSDVNWKPLEEALKVRNEQSLPLLFVLNDWRPPKDKGARLENSDALLLESIRRRAEQYGVPFDYILCNALRYNELHEMHSDDELYDTGIPVLREKLLMLIAMSREHMQVRSSLRKLSEALDGSLLEVQSKLAHLEGKMKEKATLESAITEVHSNNLDLVTSQSLRLKDDLLDRISSAAGTGDEEALNESIKSCIHEYSAELSEEIKRQIDMMEGSISKAANDLDVNLSVESAAKLKTYVEKNFEKDESDTGVSAILAPILVFLPPPLKIIGVVVGIVFDLFKAIFGSSSKSEQRNAEFQKWYSLVESYCSKTASSFKKNGVDLVNKIKNTMMSTVAKDFPPSQEAAALTEEATGIRLNKNNTDSAIQCLDTRLWENR